MPNLPLSSAEMYYKDVYHVLVGIYDSVTTVHRSVTIYTGIQDLYPGLDVVGLINSNITLGSNEDVVNVAVFRADGFNFS